MEIKIELENVLNLSPDEIKTLLVIKKITLFFGIGNVGEDYLRLEHSQLKKLSNMSTFGIDTAKKGLLEKGIIESPTSQLVKVRFTEFSKTFIK